MASAASLTSESSLLDDAARRSHSRNPLVPSSPSNPNEAEATASASPNAESLGTETTGRESGLVVDELDDPNPASGSGPNLYFSSLPDPTEDPLSRDPPHVPLHGTTRASIGVLLAWRNELTTAQLQYNAAVAALEAARQRRHVAWESYFLLLGGCVADHLHPPGSSASNRSPIRRKRKRQAASYNEGDARDDDGDGRRVKKKVRWTPLERCAANLLFWLLHYKINKRSSDSVEIHRNRKYQTRSISKKKT